MRRAFYVEEGDNVLCALFEGEELTRFYRLPKRPKTGAIVLGKVKFVRPGVGVFVEIGLDHDGILPFRGGLKSGDSVLVRIETEPQEERGCSLTEKISLAGKYVVFTGDGKINFSRTIPEDRKMALSALDGGEYGLLFRSLAKEAEIDLIQEEIKKLKERYDEIRRQAKNLSPVKYLYEEEALDVIKKIADEVVFGFDTDLEREVKNLSERKIVTSGVELVFDKTEAMTVVDVNFHASAQRGERAIYMANEIAVKVFARQLRLRNIGGIIVLDYISGKREEGEKLFALLKEELKKDYVRCQVEHAEKTGVFIVTRTERYSS